MFKPSIKVTDNSDLNIIIIYFNFLSKFWQILYKFVNYLTISKEIRILHSILNKYKA